VDNGSTEFCAVAVIDVDARDARVEYANQVLSDEGISLSIERRGSKLSVRGTLPDKRHPKGRKQKRIPLDLPATQDGVHLAVAKARAIWEDVSCARDANILSLHDSIKDLTCEETEVEVPHAGRCDGIDASGAIVEVKTERATAKDVGQLFSYMHRMNKKTGRIIAPGFRDDAIKLLKILNATGYSVQAQELSFTDVDVA